MILLRIIFLIAALVLTACQLKPTVSKTEVVNNDHKNQVLVDTRDNLQYATFHLAGSVHLQSADFIILKNPKTQKRIFDPDLVQTIERLAKKGISPEKSVVLVSDDENSLENKKWTWLLKQLGVVQIKVAHLKQFKNRIPQAKPDWEKPWVVKKPEIIIQKAERCFLNWSESFCKD